MYTNIQIYKYTNIQIYKYTNIQTYKHTNIQTYRYTSDCKGTSTFKLNDVDTATFRELYW